MKPLSRRLMTMVMALAWLSLGTASSWAQLLTDIPANAKEIRIDEKLGGEIPKGLVFEDERGQVRQLGHFIHANRPLILTLNYSDCPGLCVAQLDGLVEGIDRLYQLELGKDFEVISISIDPRDHAEKLRQMKSKYATGIRKPHSVEGWHFLSGSPESIAEIADAVGFRYTYDKANNRYNHAAAAIFISPKGKITRYLYDVSFDPNTLKLALLEASEGKIGRTIDAFLLWCMHYSGTENRYSADARKLLAVSAGAFALVLAGFVSPFWFLTRRVGHATHADLTKSADGEFTEAVTERTAETTSNPMVTSER